jgi:hypothetical protein
MLIWAPQQRQYLYCCTSKASKLRTCAGLQMNTNRHPFLYADMQMCTNMRGAGERRVFHGACLRGGCSCAWRRDLVCCSSASEWCVPAHSPHPRQVEMYVYVYVCMYVWMYVYIYVYVCVYVCIFMFVCIYMYGYVCVYMSIYTYTYITYIYIYTYM